MSQNGPAKSGTDRVKHRLRSAIYDRLSSYLVWRYRRKGMRIGKDCKISRFAKLDLTYPKGISIGDNTAISFRSAVLTHDFINGRHLSTRIGDNCFVGAHSIMPGVSIGDNAIVSSGSVVYTDVPPRTVVAGNPARVVETDIVNGRWGIRDPVFLAEENISSSASTAKELAAIPASPPPRMRIDQDDHLSFLAARLPDGASFDTDFDALGIDSFGMIALRAEVEERLGEQIADSDWTKVERPSEVLAMLERKAEAASYSSSGNWPLLRECPIGMPQMAMGGLSESWFFKEIGDLHWSGLTSALGVNSRSITGQDGGRLYATFTRIGYRASTCLANVEENDVLQLEGDQTRVGAGIFLATIAGKVGSTSIEASLMSSFSQFGKRGDARTLQRGQPDLPAGFPIPALSETPEFVQGYRNLRASEPPDILFETEYRLVPQHDINGVGLLYFAAYPTICDICLARYLPDGEIWSPMARDISYFANSGSDQSITYRLHEIQRDGSCLKVLGSLVRSDGKTMALCSAEYERRETMLGAVDG